MGWWIAPDADNALNNASITVDSYADCGIVDEASANAAANAIDEGISTDTIKLLVNKGINPTKRTGKNNVVIAGTIFTTASVNACRVEMTRVSSETDWTSVTDAMMM